jgi:DNA polymerase (family 10)
LKLRDARVLAEKIQSVLAPFCLPDRCEIAGSIRRARPEVNDIDVVCIVQPGRLAALIERVSARNEIVKNGEQNLVARTKDGVQVDLRFAHNGIPDLLAPAPSNWGAQLLCWTGSKEHNVWLNERARAQGLMLRAGHALVAEPDTRKEKIIASATEEEIFQCLGLEWIAPVQRERGGATLRGAVERDQGSTESHPTAPVPEVEFENAARSFGGDE